MEGLEKALPQIKAAQTSRMLLKQLELEEISLDEYLLKCAYWGMKTLDDIYFMSLPTKPLEVIEYEQLSYYKRQRLSQEFFADNPGIMRYYDQKKWIEIMNKTGLLKLKAIKKYMPESDTVSHGKLDKKITDFKMKMEGYDEH